MPKRDDIQTILIIGSGPIVVGQGCEFDYSGAQACKALREEGYQVVLVNSNPATIMTDPEFSDRTYIEPINPEAVAKIIEKEKDGPYHIDALLPTLGGQTALNCGCQLFDDGTLEKHHITMIGANRETIYRAEDRQQFKDIVERIGLKCPESGTANSMEEAWQIVERTGLPAIIRPAFTLGGSGGGIAYNREEFEDIARRGLDASMTHQILIDQSVIGWKEYELEMMRDHDDNVVVICAIENLDPMGVHTGDSITVAPAQTLTDKEYQQMRDAAQAIMRAIGVDTGGSNIQFCVDPDTGEMRVVEMNPRVSRSSALASKATGFPIAKIAAKLAAGYNLWELPNDITGQTVACFEPTIDYVVTKLPRWTFEKFPEADETLTTQMKSVGEAMSIGRTFKESLQKGIRSMEVKRFGLGLDANDKWLQAARSGQVAKWSSAQDDHAGSVPESLDPSIPSDWPIEDTKLSRKLTVPSQGRLYYVRYALKMGWSVQQVHEATNIDPWFLDQLCQLVDFERQLTAYADLESLPRELLFEAKQLGYSDAQLANLYFGKINDENILKVRRHRQALTIEPVYKLVDTCAAEFEATTPYYYSTYEAPITSVTPSDDAGFSDAPQPPAVADDEIRVTEKPKIVILGGGPNRIGQGIEFDYCCVQAAFAADELGFESVMVNSNPETVSTDYDTSDLLFFEPLTLEDVLNLCERLNGGRFSDSSEHNRVRGVVVQFGGQTPLNLAHGLEKAGVPIIGTSVDSIDLAEDRQRFSSIIHKLGIQQPGNGIAYNIEEAIQIAERIGYPVLVRPSFVLGGRAMETVFDEEQLRHYMAIAIGASDLEGQPILVDKFLPEAIEVDIDVVADYASDQVAKWPSDQGDTKGQGASSPNGSATGPLDHSATALVTGVMEHIEEAGVHSGDSACAVPPHSLPGEVVDQLKTASRQLAEAFQVRGLMNVQWAVRRRAADEQHAMGEAAGQWQHATVGDYELCVLEVNPRASRTVPFVSKATGVPWARVAARVMAGRQLPEAGASKEITPDHTSVKESVFPFKKFPGTDIILGPEMRSTGEVMGVDPNFPIAFAKSQMATGLPLPTEGSVFVSVRDSDKPQVVALVRQLTEMGLPVYTTGGTHGYLQTRGIETNKLKKISEGRPNAVDMIKNHELALIINTPTRKGLKTDEGQLRSVALRFEVPITTTMTAAAAAVRAITALRAGQWQVRALQDYFPHLQREPAPAPSATP
jgi:carbamoyl-phosphate synthase large subunit